MTGHDNASWGASAIKKIKGIAKALWGEFESWEELQKFLLLAIVFFFLIGTYWTLRPIKDSIFDALVGGEAYQPIAKIVSMLVIFPLVIFYSKLIDMFPRERVFYGLIALYALLALFFFGVFHYHPEYGLIGAKRHALNMFGWAWYVYVESFGSLLIALFWAITADVTMPAVAQRAFPLIVFFGQLGNIVGPLYLRATRFGFMTSAPVVALCAVGMACAGVVLFVFMHVTPPRLLKGYHGKNEAKEEKEQEPGFLEGLRILISNWYLLGIFFIVTVYEIIITIVDYHFKVTVINAYDTEAARAAYLSDYAVWVGVVALVSIALGIGNIQKWLGIRAALFLTPLFVLLAIVTLKLYPTALPVIFYIMIFSKALNYALNQPILKQLYIPTTHDTKYKAQAWSDMFGSRGAKAGSSLINASKTRYFMKIWGSLRGVEYFILATTILSLGLIGAWFVVAVLIAQTYNKAIKENRVVC